MKGIYYKIVLYNNADMIDSKHLKGRINGQRQNGMRHIITQQVNKVSLEYYCHKYDSDES